jgi:hypothetical protein
LGGKQGPIKGSLEGNLGDKTSKVFTSFNFRSFSSNQDKTDIQNPLNSYLITRKKKKKLSPSKKKKKLSHANKKVLAKYDLLCGTHLRPVRLAYQPPASSTFLSQQTSHQQPASSALLSESHQPPANRTG